jgi:hypothetical protein
LPTYQADQRLQTLTVQPLSPRHAGLPDLVRGVEVQGGADQDGLAERRHQPGRPERRNRSNGKPQLTPVSMVAGMVIRWVRAFREIVSASN